MLVTLAVILLALWLIGLVAGFVVNGLIHVLLVLAIVIILFRLFSGRKAV